MSHQKRIFISNIDTELGYQLVETFRNDHIKIENTICIIGSTCMHNLAQPILHPSIYKLINPSKQLNLLLKAVTQCDLIILDIRKTSIEAQYILKVLRNLNITEKKRVIGISNFGTWIHTRPILQPYDQISKELLLQKCVSEKYGEPFNDSHFLRRISPPNFIPSYQLENMVLSCNLIPNLQSQVICTGLIYGGASSQIANRLLQATEFQQIKCYGGGQNYIPFIHIHDITQIIQKVVEDKSIIKRYIFAVEPSYVLQIQFLSTLQKQCLNKKNINKLQLRYICDQQLYFGSSIRFETSKQILNINWKSKNIVDFVPKMMQQFYQCTQKKPKKIWFEENWLSNEQKLQIVQELKEKFQIINEQYLNKLCTQIQSSQINKPKEVKEEIIQKVPSREKQSSKGQKNKNNIALQNKLLLEELQRMHKKALSIIIETMSLKNHVLIISDTLSEPFKLILATQYVKITKDFEQGSIQYKSLQYNSFCKCKNEIKNLQNNNAVEQIVAPEQSEQKEIQNKSNFQQKRRQSSLNKNLGKRSSKEDLRRNPTLLNQYLLDNVICYVSQALYSLKNQEKTQSITNLIAQLRKTLRIEENLAENIKS